MKQRFITLLLTILFIGIGCAYSQDKKVGFLYIYNNASDRTSDLKRYRITSDLVITPQDDDKILVKSSLYNDSMERESISSMGILIEEDNDMSDVNDIQAPDADWAVYTIEGYLIDKSNTAEPDFSKLAHGKTYIVKEGSRIFKYIRLK